MSALYDVEDDNNSFIFWDSKLDDGILVDASNEEVNSELDDDDKVSGVNDLRVFEESLIGCLDFLVTCRFWHLFFYWINNIFFFTFNFLQYI